MPVSHYFDPAPSGPSTPRTVVLALPDLTIELTTDRGVFSGDHVDAGTRLLLQEVPPPPAGVLLDLGCGYGPIAVTLARRAPGGRVWAVDVNARARALTAANAAAAGATNVEVAAPDEVPADLRFAALYSNPPIRVGKAPLHDLLEAWIPRADVAYLVVSKHLGADSLARWMEAEHGWQVHRRLSRVGYRLLEVHPAPEGGTQP
jgi:16S rRNA (guanine1207-N2)-methyltransferase